MFTVSKKFRFEAAHALTHLPPNHKCHRVHGHSYIVEVVIRSKDLDHRNFASVDYGELNALQDHINEEFDHRFLNDVLGGGEQTTAEKLARYFYGWCKVRWGNTHAVRVYETADTCVEFSLQDNLVEVRHRCEMLDAQAGGPTP